MSGVPVRLVRKNGELIELLATDITLDVQRKTGGIALPMTGSTRIGFDLNMNNAVIILNGVITDDDIIYTTGSTKAAKSFIDFSGTHLSINDLQTSVWTTEIDRIIQGQDASASDASNIAAAVHSIKLIASDGTAFDIYLAISSSTSGTSGGRYYISVNDSSGSNRSAVNIATYLNTLINASLSAHFTSTLVASTVTPLAGTTKVVITSVVKSNAANTASPAMTAGSWPSEAKRPYHGKFKGGYNELSKSAGDKVMDLFGTLNNSNNGGLGNIGSLGMSFLLSAGHALTNDTDENLGNFTDAVYGDYIIGIQIPYNSMTKATGSNKYDPVNFFMPTGPFHSATSKDSSNALPAGTEFEWIDNDYTGIQGTVQKATFVQLGGEPIYQFTIIFAPIDIII